MAEEKYCPVCRAPWVWGNDFCVQCGHSVPHQSMRARGDGFAVRVHERLGHRG